MSDSNDVVRSLRAQGWPWERIQESLTKGKKSDFEAAIQAVKEEEERAAQAARERSAKTKKTATPTADVSAHARPVYSGRAVPESAGNFEV